MEEINRSPKESLIENPQTIFKITQNYLENYYQAQKKEDQYFALGIKNQTLKFIFDLLIKLSYVLFVIAIVIDLTSSSQTSGKFFDYVGNEDRLPFLIVLAFQAILVYSLMKIYTQPNKLMPQTRKNVNFLTDIARVITYIIIVIFIQPFAYSQGIPTLTLISFWLLVIALILFIIRKMIKWQYYKFGDGANDNKRWQSIDNNNSFSKLFDTATFIDHLQKTLPDTRSKSLINVETKQYLDKLEKKLNNILKNKEEFYQQIKDEQQKLQIMRKLLLKKQQKYK